jgi:hypothetical protein
MYNPPVFAEWATIWTLFIMHPYMLLSGRRAYDIWPASVLFVVLAHHIRC